MSNEGGYADAQAALLKTPMSPALRAWIESDSPYGRRGACPGLDTHKTSPRIPDPTVTEDERLAWVAADPFLREGMRRATQRALVNLERFRPEKKELTSEQGA